MSDFTPSADDPSFERHRPILRKFDKRLSTVYGFGGSLIFFLGICIPGLIAWREHLFTQPLLYIVAFLVVCIGFFILRIYVRKVRGEIKSLYLSYCTANQIDPEALIQQVESDEMYSFVVSVFKEPASNTSA